MRTWKLTAALAATLFLSGLLPARISAHAPEASVTDEETGENEYRNQRSEFENPQNEVTAELEQEALVYHEPEAGLLTYIADPVNTLNGIDISHWNHPFDVSKVAADFLICKATGGTGFKDPSFRDHADQILKNGRLLGFYHYARDWGHKGTAVAEAEFFYSQTKDYIGKGIPVLDWEEDLYLGVEWAKAFLDRYYELSGVKCLLYTSASVTRTWDWTSVSSAGYKLWLAQYSDYKGARGYQNNLWIDNKGLGSFGSYVMHQYTPLGRLDGFNGVLDLDKFYGTRQDWLEMQKTDAQKEAEKKVFTPQFPETDTWQVYRLYNPNSGEHVYTSNKEEYDYLDQIGWDGEGNAWLSKNKTGIGVTRLYNPNAGDHHYTTDQNEIDYLVKAGWIDEGIFWYAEGNTGIPVYRLYNPNAITGAHHFTTDENEKNVLSELGWKYEGVQFYAAREKEDEKAADEKKDSADAGNIAADQKK